MEVYAYICNTCTCMFLLQLYTDRLVTCAHAPPDLPEPAPGSEKQIIERFFVNNKEVRQVICICIIGRAELRTRYPDNGYPVDGSSYIVFNLIYVVFAVYYKNDLRNNRDIQFTYIPAISPPPTLGGRGEFLSKLKNREEFEGGLEKRK